MGQKQSSFVLGRQITDNIVVMQEIIDSMRTHTGKAEWMAIKVDLEKAYDRLRCEFIHDPMLLANFPPSLINLIMDFICTARMRVLWNGDQSKEFAMSCRICLGDPLSPYIFVIYMEHLAHLIRDSMDSNEWKPICVIRIAPPISHIFFADDHVLFGECSLEQTNVILNCLDRFCNASSEKVSKEKTKIFFSKHVSSTLVNHMLV